MGIKGFSNAFEAHREYPCKTSSATMYKHMRGMRIAVDAFYIIHSGAVGASHVSQLTDAAGNPTMHISSVLGVIMGLYENGADQTWVFDAPRDGQQSGTNTNPAKLKELMRRADARREAEAKLQGLDGVTGTQADRDAALFEGVDVVVPNATVAPTATSITDTSTATSDVTLKRNALEKRAFRITKEMIEDTQMLLNCLGISWTTAPAGVEGEALAAMMCWPENDLCDAVYSGDSDPILFGAPILFRRITMGHRKGIVEYHLQDILDAIESETGHSGTREALAIMGVALGGDFAPKVPRVGTKTVWKWYKKQGAAAPALNEEQKNAVQQYLTFHEKIDFSKITLHNGDEDHPISEGHITTTLDWLETVKQFDRTIRNRRIQKAVTKRAKLP